MSPRNCEHHIDDDLVIAPDRCTVYRRSTERLNAEQLADWCHPRVSRPPTAQWEGSLSQVARVAGIV